jgi:hypothetical protein
MMREWGSLLVGESRIVMHLMYRYLRNIEPKNGSSISFFVPKHRIEIPRNYLGDCSADISMILDILKRFPGKQNE